MAIADYWKCVKCNKLNQAHHPTCLGCGDAAPDIKRVLAWGKVWNGVKEAYTTPPASTTKVTLRCDAGCPELGVTAGAAYKVKYCPFCGVAYRTELLTPEDQAWLNEINKAFSLPLGSSDTQVNSK